MPSGEEEFGSLVHLFLLAGSKSIEMEGGGKPYPTLFIKIYRIKKLNVSRFFNATPVPLATAWRVSSGTVN